MDARAHGFLADEDEHEEDEPSERLFDPSRYPSSPKLLQFTAEQTAQLSAFEIDSKRRQRQRRAGRDQERFEQAVAAILCDAIHAELTEPSSWRYASFSKEKLGRAGHGPDFITETFPAVVRCMSEPAMALLEYQLGVYSPFGGRCTTIRAGHHLRSAIKNLGLHYGDLGCNLSLRGDSIRLRGPRKEGQKRGDILPVLAGEPTETFRREVDRLNHWYAQADLGCSVLPDGRLCDLSSRYLRRHFNNGRMDQGGRFFGAFWVDMKAKYRLECLTINGERVVSLDFGQCAVRIAYGYAGIPTPTGDMYDVNGLDRDGVKKVMNALLHSSKELARFPRESRSNFRGDYEFHQVLGGIVARHRPIAHLFGTGFGMTGFFIESQIIVRSLLDLMEIGITALPVHDCVLVPRSAALMAREILLKNFRLIAGAEGVVEMEQHKYIAMPLAR